jgi:NADP-dependent 3-hydroxy acid dehydrogenase YdfG
VVLGARRSGELQAVASEIVRSGGAAAWQLTDVSKRADMLSLCRLASDRYGKLDVLISDGGQISRDRNLAGICRNEQPDDVDGNDIVIRPTVQA